MTKITLDLANPVEAAIVVVGGPSAFAREIGVSRMTVAKWRKRGRFPDHRIQAVAEITGLSIKALS